MTLQPRSESLAGRILAALQDNPHGASDGELALRFGKRPQAVNKACHDLESQGLLVRERHGATLINRLVLGTLEMSAPLPLPTARPWFWEGNVQDRVVEYLVRVGWTIQRVADTASREPGKDIIAERNQATLWVTVKGYAVRTERTHPSTQAQHSFAEALYDVTRWRQENSLVLLAVALPLFKRYQDLRESTRWLESAAPFSYLWVTEAGDAVSDPEAITETRRSG